jgi:hypothetical protein
MNVIDNFLPDHIFNELRDQIMSGLFPWYYSDYIVDDGDNLDNQFYSHMFYDKYQPNTTHMNIVYPLIEKLNPSAILRIKANSYVRGSEIIESDMHQDFLYEHYSAVFSINTNNGYTLFEDGTKVDSVANRIAIFDGRMFHCSANCTDEKRRVNIALSYLKPK